MADAEARKEKERLLRERRRQRILAGSSSRLGLITGVTTSAAKTAETSGDADEQTAAAPALAATKEGVTVPQRDAAEAGASGGGQREEAGAPVQLAAQPTARLTQPRRPSTTTETGEGAHGTYTGTLTFEEGVELPSPSSLLAQAASGAEFAATLLPHLTKGSSSATNAKAPKPRPTVGRVSVVVSIVTLAIVLGCAFFLGDIPSMQDNVLVRLLASDEPGAWLNVRSSSVIVPFFTLEAALMLVAFLGARLTGQRQEPSAASSGVWWFFSLPFGRVFADMSLFLFSFVVTIDLLSFAWPWLNGNNSSINE